MAPDHWSLIQLEFIFTKPWNSPSWKGPRSDISLSPLPAVSASSSMDSGLQFHCGPQGQQAPFYNQLCAYLWERTLLTPTEWRTTTSEFQEIATSAIEWNHPDLLQKLHGNLVLIAISKCKYRSLHHTEVCCKPSFTVLWIRYLWFFQMVNSASFPLFLSGFIHLPFSCTM